LRTLRQIRLAKTRELYEMLEIAVDPAMADYDKFNSGLQDHELFLAQDFNASSLADIREDVRGLVRLASDLDIKLDETLAAARMYIDSAAMPVGSGTSVITDEAPITTPPAPPRVRKLKQSDGVDKDAGFRKSR
jgi:hypothetical protein